MIIALLYFYIFIIGSVMGSFLGSLIYRESLEKRSTRKRSFCPHCNHTLGPLDLVPIVSFIALKGRCRYCKAKIHPRYLLVEITTSLVYVLSFYLLQNSEFNEIKLVYLLAVVTVLIGLFYSDLFFGILPNSLIVFGYSLSLIYITYQSLILEENLLSSHLITSLGAGSFFLSLILVTRGRGMGGGDMKLAFWVGLLLGWPSVFSALFLAFLTGSILSVMLILLRLKRFGQTIPFGPFIVACTYVSLFWGNQIFNWYLGFTAR